MKKLLFIVNGCGYTHPTKEKRKKKKRKETTTTTER
jgi:hypothetical protein